MIDLSPDRATIERFINAMLSEQIHLATIDPETRVVKGHDFGTDFRSAIDWVVARNMAGLNIHYTANQVRAGVDKKPRKEDIVRARMVHVDIDPPKEGGALDIRQLVDELMAYPSPPNAIVNSGNGLQALWKINDGSIEAVEAVNNGLIHRFSGDRGTQNADRLLRFPGTINWPDSNKRRRGRVPALATLVHIDNGDGFDLADLAALFPEGTPPARTRKKAGCRQPRISIAGLDADALGLATHDLLRKLIEAPRGEDRSRDTFAFACKALERGYSGEQVVGVLLNPANAISAHCLDQNDPVRAAERALESARNDTKEARRLRQRGEDRLIGEELYDLPRSPAVTLDQLLESKVFIADGSLIADLERPRCMLSKPDFINAYAGSKEEFSVYNQNKSVPVTSLWLQHPERLQAHTVTFRPGDGLFTLDPETREAFNLWRPLDLGNVAPDWAERAKPFEEHLRWLWGDDADKFIDWLAHIIQRPQELPSFGWLHVAPQQGLGRNWVSSILKRLLKSDVALGFDLMGALKSGFNGDLSMRLLAVVDEIDEGGGIERYRHAQALKQIVTEETRLINPKYGRQRTEFNCCRWLIFSNSLTALPLEERDRRFWVVRCDSQPQDPSYYRRLYALRDDPEFITSVGYWLKERDISSFQPGAAPPMNAAKQDMLERTRTPEEQCLHDVKARWPLDLITSEEIKLLMGANVLTGAGLRHALDRAGLERVGVYKAPSGGGRHKIIVYARDNIFEWKSASTVAIRQHINSLSFKMKEEIMENA